ncbi:MAG: acetyl-CoA carboxylase biotin carboxyl carrier protein [Tepidisphaeraceae bacterium]
MSDKKPSKSPKNGGSNKLSESGPMDVHLLERLVKLMQANDLNALELRDGDKRVILKRGAVAAASAPMMYAPQPAAPTPPPAAKPAAEPENFLEIKSPMVGTFYVAPSPDAKPFVSIGSSVDEETDVCVIEAMKVFNNVKAECSGTIARVLVDNGEVVEFGQVLFLVKP